MIKVTGSSGSGGARPSRAATSSKASTGGFAVGESAPATPARDAAPTAEAAPASALGALIALQSEGRSSARNRAAAERMLILLERLRDGLLAGRIAKRDLAAIADAAHARLNDADERIAAIYAEIALRARVELAKLGR